MTISKSMLARNTACDSITGMLDSSGLLYTTSHLSIYTVDGTRISWNALDTTAFGTSVDATATANVISDTTALIDGTANNFAFENRDGTAIWTGNVTAVGGGGSLELQQVYIPQDSTIVISSAIYIVPA